LQTYRYDRFAGKQKLSSADRNWWTIQKRDADFVAAAAAGATLARSV
jgi:hypothetical protein